MRQRKTRSIPKTGVKTFEKEKLSAFLHSLPEGAMLYSPLSAFLPQQAAIHCRPTTLLLAGRQQERTCGVCRS